MGTDFAFCLSLNTGAQKKTSPIFYFPKPFIYKALKPPSGMPLKRTKSTFFRVSIFKKSAITTPIFDLFSPLPNCETLINSHFQFLRWGNFSKKELFLRGKIPIFKNYANKGTYSGYSLKPLLYKAFKEPFSHRFYTLSPFISRILVVFNPYVIAKDTACYIPVTFKDIIDFLLSLLVKKLALFLL